VSTSPTIARVLERLRRFREEAGLAASELEERLILGPGWIESFENGDAIPTLDALLAILHALDRSPEEMFSDLEVEPTAGALQRLLFAEQDGRALVLHFQYADHDATYRLPDASIKEFEGVLRELRDGLAGDGQKSDAVVWAFEKAVRAWPQANPSDLWWFLLCRAYLDPFNHPASEARRNLDQSWKRTGGWALERILVRHYSAFLEEKGITISIPTGEEKSRLLDQLDVPSRLEVDKVDVVLSGRTDSNEPKCFGVVHVKASFAERRTDDVELSRGLVGAGYCSPFWTMDCKSSPGLAPVNRGELGELLSEADDSRSAKRKDFEVDGFFSACFSYNQRTKATPEKQDVAARVYVCNFKDPNDDFSSFVRTEWERFKKQ
jgi:transcriptional regulator with XRE-family HTH domain